MKRTKKAIALALAMSLTAAAAGCGNSDSGSAASDSRESKSQESKAPEGAEGGEEQSPEAAAQGEDGAESVQGESGLPPMTEEEITLTYACWGLGEKGEIEAKDKQIEAFEKAYPNIHVEFVTIDQATWDDSLTSMAATGSLPDVFWVFSATNAVANEWALDVTDYYEADPDAREVYPEMVENAKLNGRLYCMPTVMFPYLVFLNKTYFEKYNEPLPSYDWTMDEFKEIAERITHPEEFYFGTSNPNYIDYFPALYEGYSNRGWDGEEYHFDQVWVDALNLKYDWIDDDTLEWESAEDKLRYLGDEGAWPPAFGRSAMHFDWSWTIAAFEDAYTAQSGCEFLYYPQPAGPSGAEMAVVDYGVISAATEHPREAWELQKWTSWGKEGVLNRYEGYKQAGLTAISRMPVTSNSEAWAAVKSFTDREDFLALYDHLEKTNIVSSTTSVAPGYNEMTTWMDENGIWGKLDSREVSPADVAAELTQKANELKDEWLANHVK